VTRCAGEGQIHQPQSAWQPRSRRRLSPFANHARGRSYSISRAIRVPVVHASQILRQTKVANQPAVCGVPHTHANIRSRASKPQWTMEIIVSACSPPRDQFSTTPREQANLWELCYTHTWQAPTRLQIYLLDTHERLPASFKTSARPTPEMYASTTTLPLAAPALHQLHRASRLLISRSHGLYINYAVGRDYESPGCTGSTSTLSCAVSPLDFSSVGRTGSRRASGHCVSRRDYSSSRLHWLYCAYVVHPDAPSHRSTSRRSIALALIVRPATASRGATTHCPDCVDG
jgi:hypothetical protein